MKKIKGWLLAGSLALCACGGGGGGGEGPPGPATLLVSDVSGGLVAIWRPVDAVDGDVAPDSIIGGMANADFNSPYGMHYDSRGDTLVVGDLYNNAVKFFDGVSGLDGDVAPTRTLAGAATLLVGDNAYEVFVDRARDLLYLAHENGVFVYANASTLDGDVAPVRNITGAATGLSSGRDKRIFVDEAHDRLYVLDSGNSRLVVYDNASTVDGDAAPDRVLEGPNTQFDFPWGLDVDVGRDIVYISDESNSEVYIFDGASTLNGDIAPSRILSGAGSMLEDPADLVVDPATDTLYVTIDGTAEGVLVWENASTVDGEAAPTRTIIGAGTSLSSPKDLAIAR